MKWKIQLVGDDFDLQELEKSFSDASNFSISKEKNGYYLSSTEFDSCKSDEEVKNKSKDILDVLNGVKTLVLGGNKLSGRIVLEKNDGSKTTYVEQTEKYIPRDSFTGSVVEKSNEEIINKVHPADKVPKWLNLALHNKELKRALKIYGKENHTWVGLYKVYEIIEDSVGIQKIQGWVTKSSIKRFKHTANSPSAIGDEARHGKERTTEPKNPMPLDEAHSLVKILLLKWLNSNES